MKTKKQTIPKWFKGSIYEQGETVINPFSNRRIRTKRLRAFYIRFYNG